MLRAEKLFKNLHNYAPKPHSIPLPSRFNPHKMKIYYSAKLPALVTVIPWKIMMFFLELSEMRI